MLCTAWITIIRKAMEMGLLRTIKLISGIKHMNYERLQKLKLLDLKKLLGGVLTAVHTFLVE